MEVISTRRYEARPPASSVPPKLYDPENSIATVKEEEWETRKKKEITTTRQIETRVKRQVVLEDGEVVKDSGPLVTTNTTEDVEQQEHTTQERKTNGDDPKEIEWPSSSGKKEPGVVVQKELNETVVRSHEETEELLETEDRRQLGDITDEAYQQAIQNNRGDLRISLVESAGKQLTKKSPAAGPKILKHTTKSNKVIDTEKTLERKQLKSDGLIVTESKKTVEHEEIKDVPSNKEEEEEEEENNVNNSNEEFETRKESSQRFIKKRDEDIVDYVTGTGEKIAREMRYVSEITEGERIGNWPPPPDTMKTIRLAKPANNNITGSPSAAVDDASPMSRKDALTKKPLDPDEEDEARKFETSKWLENHFGSESRSSHGSHDSIIDHNLDRDHVQTATNKSFINVTMKSYKKRDDFNQYNNNNNNNNNNNDDDNNNNNHYEKNKILRSRELESPSGYFHGISEWSERFQRSSSDKQNNGTIPRINNSPKHQVIEMRTNGNLSSRRESPMDNKNFINRQKESTYMKNNYSQLSTTTTTTTSSSSLSSKHQPINSVPSPPVRTRLSQHQEEKGEKETCPSPVHVVQRTWENRSRHCYSPTRSNSSSPLHTPPRSLEKINQRKHIVARRSPSPPNQTTTKSSKIGQSFRKLVSKLRSASLERKIKKNDNNSVSQVTQTDNDDSTYLQYNLIDKNIPEIIIANDNNNKPPERPPRLPKTTANPPSSPPTAVTKTIKVTRSIDEQYKSRNASPKLKTSPHDKYYTSEQSKYSSSSSSLLSPRSSHEIQNGNHHRSTSKNIESNTLGRLSKSTSRLVNDNYYTATQTLPIKSNNHHHRRPPPPPPSNQSSRHYNSMINISIKNSVTSSSPPPLNSLNFKKSPKKNIMTERRGDDGDNYNKSSLLRSKSFNVEANGGDYTRIPYKSNTQLNRLDETPPLKSPGILASISQSNRDLFKHDYY